MIEGFGDDFFFLLSVCLPCKLQVSHKRSSKTEHRAGCVPSRMLYMADNMSTSPPCLHVAFLLVNGSLMTRIQSHVRFVWRNAAQRLRAFQDVGHGKCHTNSANMHACCPGPAREEDTWKVFWVPKNTPS